VSRTGSSPTNSKQLSYRLSALPQGVWARASQLIDDIGGRIDDGVGHRRSRNSNQPPHPL